MTIREAPLIIIEDRGLFLVLVSDERHPAILDVSTPERREQSQDVLESLHDLGNRMWYQDKISVRAS